MTQRDIFIYGLVALALLLFVVRLWLVNGPQAEQVQPAIVQSLPAENLEEGDQRTITLPANDPNWKPVGRGPLIITATGRVDLGGIKTVPTTKKGPAMRKLSSPHFLMACWSAASARTASLSGSVPGHRSGSVRCST